MNRSTLYVILLLLTSCYSKANKNRISKITKLPLFEILSLDSSCCVNTANLITRKPILFMYFGPNCEFCHLETKELLAHLKDLQHINIYMIANESSISTKEFYDKYRLDTAKNIFVGNDYNSSFYNAFQPPSTPFIAIYNSRRMLVKIYQERPSIKSIIKATRH